MEITESYAFSSFPSAVSCFFTRRFHWTAVILTPLSQKMVSELERVPLTGPLGVDLPRGRRWGVIFRLQHSPFSVSSPVSLSCIALCSSFDRAIRSIRTIGIPGTAPPAKHGVLLLPLPSSHISCSLYIDIGLFAIFSLLIASIVLIYNPFPRSPIPPPSHATAARYIYPFRGMLRVWSGFPRACM